METPITSRQNPRIKNAVKLRDRSGREAQHRIIIDGIREIGRALSGGVELLELFVCDSLLGEEARLFVDRLGNESFDIIPVTEPVFAKLAFGDRVDGVVAIAVPPRFTLESLDVEREMLLAVLERIEKPGNIGAVMRSADAAGVDAVILAGAGTDRYNPNAIRASAGTIFSIPLISVTSEEALAWLRRNEFQMFATRVDGALDYTDATYAGRCAIVLGSEAHGLSDVWQGEDVSTVKLPMCGVGDSLNVSVTAAVLFYERLRQKNASSSS